MVMCNDNAFRYVFFELDAEMLDTRKRKPHKGKKLYTSFISSVYYRTI